MSDSTSPVICITCQRPLAPVLKQADSPRYIAQHSLLPTADDGEEFALQVQTIMGYIRAVSTAAFWADKHIGEVISDTLFQLIEELSAEAERRLVLAMNAMGDLWERTQNQATPTQPEKATSPRSKTKRAA